MDFTIYWYLNFKLERHPFLLINLYNPHTETGQARALTTFSNMLKGFDMNNKYQWIFSGDVYLLIYNKPEASGGNPKIKKLF